MKRNKFPNLTARRIDDVDSLCEDFDRKVQEQRPKDEIEIWDRLCYQWGGMDSISKERK